MAVEEYFPFDSGLGADSTEVRWARMARLWAPPHVVGVAGSGAYDLTVSGLNATINRRPGPSPAEAWVDGFMHRLVDANWSTAVPANANANPRVDRIVLRRDLTANTIVLTRLTGTPAASPVAPALTQVDGGTYDLPLWRFTVPASSGTPLTGLVDERKWIDPAGGGTPLGIVAYGSSSSSQAATGSDARIVGGLNVSPTLTAGRIYEAQWRYSGTFSSSPLSTTLRAIAGPTAPTAATGTAIASDTFTSNLTGQISTTMVAATTFTVGTSGVYTISPFVLGTTTPGATGVYPPATVGMTMVVRDMGPSAGVVGTTPIVVP